MTDNCIDSPSLPSGSMFSRKSRLWGSTVFHFTYTGHFLKGSKEISLQKASLPLSRFSRLQPTLGYTWLQYACLLEHNAVYIDFQNSGQVHTSTLKYLVEDSQVGCNESRAFFELRLLTILRLLISTIECGSFKILSLIPYSYVASISAIIAKAQITNGGPGIFHNSMPFY